MTWGSRRRRFEGLLESGHEPATVEQTGHRIVRGDVRQVVVGGQYTLVFGSQDEQGVFVPSAVDDGNGHDDHQQRQDCDHDDKHARSSALSSGSLTNS